MTVLYGIYVLIFELTEYIGHVFADINVQFIAQF